MDSALFIVLGLLGIVGIGELMSANDDDEETYEADDDPNDGRALTEGTSDDDTITGTDADEAIQSYAGDDYVDAGSGDDLVWTGYEADTVAANPGTTRSILAMATTFTEPYDTDAEERNDTIHGGYGDDTIIVNAGNHSIYGGYGDDRIEDYGRMFTSRADVATT